MHHFEYRHGRLHAEDVAIEDVARTLGAPFYIYSTATITRHYKVFSDAFTGLDATIAYAMKANSNTAVMRLLAKLGAGADVVSGGELAVALRAGIDPAKIVFSGVGKSREELTFALDTGIHQINVESVPELELLDQVAQELGVKAPIALRINPDVGAGGHAKITTGKKENKFGIDWSAAHAIYRRAADMKGIAVKGIAMHIGSQIADLSPFEEAFLRMRDLVGMLRADGIRITRLDLGGGLGVPYDDGGEIPPPPPEYAEIVKRTLGDLGCSIMLEPGRLIMGNAGLLVSRVLYIKEGTTRSYVILDAAMNDLARPALYDAYHDIIPVKEPDPRAGKVAYDVVGPVCETGDTFATQRPLPPLAADDLVAFKTAGAYGAVMAGQYNSRPLVPEVLVDGDKWSVIRRRPTFEEMLGLEVMPDWLA